MSDKKIANKNFWPLGIALFLIFMVGMIILTVYISIKYKPDDDNSYFSTRGIVDMEINEILLSQKEIDSKYDLYILGTQQILPLEHRATRKSNPLIFNAEDNIILQVQIKQKNSINLIGKNTNVNTANSLSMQDSSVELYLTRFADAKDDINYGALQLDNRGDYLVFSTPTSILLKKGAWKALFKIKLDNKEVFFEQLIIIEDK